MADRVALFCGHAEEFIPRVQAWLGNSQEQGFGRGRMELLKLIRSLGSLSKAAKELGMSYRAAWGKIKEMEQFTGVHLVCSQGAKRDGYSLTPEAMILMDAFDRWFADVSAYARERAGVYFPATEAPAGHEASAPKVLSARILSAKTVGTGGPQETGQGAAGEVSK